MDRAILVHFAISKHEVFVTYIDTRISHQLRITKRHETLETFTHILRPSCHDVRPLNNQAFNYNTGILNFHS